MQSSTTTPRGEPIKAAFSAPRTLMGRTAGVSRMELERRWALVANYLRERNIDTLVAISGESNLSGTVRWLTDAPPGAYRVVVAFHANDLMTIVEHGSVGQVRELDGTKPGHLGVGELITVSQFASVAYTHGYEAELLVASLKRRGCRSIALVHGDAMPFSFRTGLQMGMGESVAVHDATPFLDRVKAMKSAEEIGLLDEAAAIQDRVFEGALKQIRPGLQNFEVASRVLGEVYQHGASNGLGGNNGVILFGSGMRGREPAVFALSGDRILRNDDAMTLLVECASPAGYIIEVGRNLVFGHAEKAQLELHGMLLEAQIATCRLLKSGARPSEIFAAHNEHMVSRGLQAEQRLYSHGQGYDMIERPLIRDDEDLPLENGMCMAVHPNAVLGGYFGYVCDNFMIEEGGTRRLHKTPQKIFEI